MFKTKQDNLKFVGYFAAFFVITVTLLYGLISYTVWDFNMWQWSHECQRVAGLLTSIMFFIGWIGAKEMTRKEALEEVKKATNARILNFPLPENTFEYKQKVNDVFLEEYEKRFGKIR